MSRRFLVTPGLACIVFALSLAWTGEAAAAAVAAAGTPNLAGTLRERGTGAPLPGILVTVFRQDAAPPVGYEATTDATGTFQFFDLPAGTWQIAIEAITGYFPYHTSETVQAGIAVTAVYYLERQSYNSYDVTVTAGAPRKEVSRTLLKNDELQRLPGTMGDPLAALVDLPGVARPPLLTGQLIVRGSAPEDSRVFVEGAEIPLIYHFGGVRSIVPVGIVQSLTFVPGNFGPDLGRATGGIVDLKMKTLSPPRVSGFADVNLMDAGAYLEVPLGAHGGVAFSARRSYLDLVLKQILPEDPTFKTTVAPHYYDYQILANYRPSARHELRALFLGSADRFTALYTDPAEVSPQLQGGGFNDSTTFYRWVLSHRYAPSASFDNTVQISQGRSQTHMSTGQVLTALDVNSAQLRDTLHVALGSRATLALGTDDVLSQTGGTIREPPARKEGQPAGNTDFSQLMQTSLDGHSIWYPSVFAELAVTPVSRLSLLPGVRVDYFGRVRQLATQPRLTARYLAADRLTLKAAAGRYVQEPAIDETDPALGNPHLGTERAMHYSVGAEVRPRPYLSFDVTLFYKSLSHLVRATDAQATDDQGVTHPLVYDNGGVGRAYGVELVARHEMAHGLTGWIAYTFSRSERRDDATAGYRLFDFDQTHILTVLCSYALPYNWEIGGRFRYTSGDPETPVTGAVFNSGTDQYDPTFGRINSTRQPAFHQLDLRVDKRWILKSWILNAYLDIQNVYNRSNQERTGYDFDYRQSIARNGLPILPIIGLRADF